MSQKKNTKYEEGAPFPKVRIPFPQVSTETKKMMSAFFLLIISIISLLGFFNGGGIVGQGLMHVFKLTFGFLAFTIPVFIGIVSIKLFRHKPLFNSLRYTGGWMLLFATMLGLSHLSVFGPQGGLIGAFVSNIFTKLFGLIGGIMTESLILIASLMLVTNERPDFTLWMQRLKKVLQFFGEKIRTLFTRKPTSKKPVAKIAAPDEEEADEDVYEEPIDLYEADSANAFSKNEKVAKAKVSKKTATVDEIVETESTPKAKKRPIDNSYVFPPLSLLSRDQGKPNTGDTKANANIIKRTLQNFGIEVEMDEITVGPTVTRYALKPAEGVKLSRIVALQNDLSLALAAHPLRIEAPIPGKSLVGIEMPNKGKSIIGFASLLSDDRFKNDPKPLMVALGKNISGIGKFANLAKMPHALIAGATGSGKSVTVHALITSLLYRNTSEDLKFIFVDPKRVELTLYNGIPHLLTPVITDPKKTIMALKWAAKEMERRYDILEKNKVRDIASYHENVFYKAKNKDEVERMPYIVFIIDELADIMQAYPRELESGIVRLAQMSRAVGIHLILSTQRPSVNVITGLIKANIPARVALQVASQIDSRTILDQPGAEKLLGAGDMLYTSGEMASPERIQCAYISEEEVKNIVAFIKDNNDILADEINLSPQALGNTEGVFSSGVEDNNGDDNLYEDAREAVIQGGRASTSYLQRKLGVGYARAAKLIDMLEERGVVGPGNGAKPREILEKGVAEEAAEFE